MGMKKNNSLFGLMTMAAMFGGMGMEGISNPSSSIKRDRELSDKEIEDYERRVRIREMSYTQKVERFFIMLFNYKQQKGQKEFKIKFHNMELPVYAINLKSANKRINKMARMCGFNFNETRETEFDFTIFKEKSKWFSENNKECTCIGMYRICKPCEDFYKIKKDE